MSYSVWSVYGYGICTTTIADTMFNSTMPDTEKIERLNKVLDLAPSFKQEFYEWVEDSEVEPIYSAYMDYEDDNCYMNIGAILKPVIKEKYNLDLTLCDDFNGTQYLLLEPWFPWASVTTEEKIVTKEKLIEIFNNITNILYDDNIEVDYQNVENGG